MAISPAETTFLWDTLLQDMSMVITILVGVLVIIKLPVKKWQLWLGRNKRDRRAIDQEIPELTQSIKTAIANQEDMTEHISRIVTELEPNHGTSMRDAINRIEALALKGDATAEAWLNLDDRALYSTDAEGLLIWCNRAFLNLHERPRDELLGVGVFSTIAEYDVNRVVSIVENFKNKHIFTPQFDYDMITPDGIIIPIRSTAHVLHDNEGEIIGLVGTITVIQKQNAEDN